MRPQQKYFYGPVHIIVSVSSFTVLFIDDVSVFLYNIDLFFGQIKMTDISLEEFLKASPSPYHAVQTAIDYLKRNGFTHARESQPLPQEPAFFTKDGTALLAYIPGSDFTKGFSSI